MYVSVHSKFLVHWTGANDMDRVAWGNAANRTQAYVERLRSIVTEGLYMRPGTEEMLGAGGEGFRIEVPRTCFSEVRLTQVREQCERYGRLGVGFDRDFVLDRLGGPVFYLPAAGKGAVIANLKGIRDTLQETNEEALKWFEVVLGFAKNMGDGTGDFKYYDEMEWRIVWLDTMPRKYWQKREIHGEIVYALNIDPQDIKVLVFPDDSVREAATGDSVLRKKLFTAHMPILVTVDECGHF